MRKMFTPSSVLALVLALALLLSAAACGGAPSDTPDSTASEDAAAESYSFGYNTWGAGSSTFDWMANSIEYTLKLYGTEGSRASDEHSADTELQNIQNFISAEHDGILMQTSADPVLPQAAQECQNAEIPFVLNTFVGQDDDRAAVSESNPFYVGAVTADLYLDGYTVGQAAAADGHKTAVLLGGNFGDNHFEQRIAGFTQSFVTEGGGEIHEIARCTSPAESQEKANAMLSANRDAACLYAMVGDYVPGALNAMDTLGLNAMKVYASNSGPETANYIKEGRVAGGNAGNDLATVIAAALMVNYKDGHQILDEAGKAPELRVKPFFVDQSNVDDFIKLFYTDGQHPISDDVMKSLVWRYNPDVGYDTFTDVIDNGLTLEAMLAKKG